MWHATLVGDRRGGSAHFLFARYTYNNTTNDVIKKVYRWTVGDGGVAVSPTLVLTGVAEAVTIRTYTGFRP